ncbi:MAG: hypothetical protein EBS83_10655 [Planctomycetia bacterium]|nr:hypothetical protein [Planctomycetia bacterium]
MNAEIESLESLLEQWADGSLPAADVAALQEMLRKDAKLRAHFVRWQMLGAALSMESDSLPTGLAESEPAKLLRAREKSPVEAGWKTLFAIAVSLAFVAIVGRWAYLEARSERVVSTPGILNSGPTAIEEPTSRGIAMVTRLVNADWEQHSSSPIGVGQALEPGTLKLRSGYAQVEFFCGASVILEGPAELELLSPTAARFLSGRLRAQVPPAARGFQIDVEGMKVVDLGTEFGLSVSAAGSDVQVFDGEVRVERDAVTSQLVRAGQSFSQKDGVINRMTVAQDEYTDLAMLDEQARDQTSERLKRWQDFSQRLRQDKRLIAYYALDQPERWQRRLKNSAEATSHDLDGAIVGAKRVAGRWPGKGALEFKQPGDRVRVSIPGEFRSLSFTCWVRIDSLDRWYNSLFLTDSYQRGEPHWQILDTGQLFFSVRVSRQKGGPEHREVLSPPFWNPTLSGKWLHLATTYDVDTKTTTHYLNGRQLIAESIPLHQLVETTRIGMASIGNWSMPTRPDSNFAIRNLNGRIDEFAIFSAALSAEEVAEMYESGKP